MNAPLPTESGISNNWLDSAPGQYLLMREQQRLDHIVSDMFGYQALQLGCPQLHALRENRMSFQLFVENKDSLTSTEVEPTCPPPLANHLLCCFEELPFDSQSCDLVVLPHSLERSANPHEVLREIERILVPEGKVVITGLNPYSLWRARHSITQLINKPYLPTAPQWLSLPRIKDWLKLLGLEILESEYDAFALPSNNLAWLENSHFMEKVGMHSWPFLGAYYSITAVKRVRGMRLIGPAWRKTNPIRRLAPSVNSHQQNTPTQHKEESR